MPNYTFDELCVICDEKGGEKEIDKFYNENFTKGVLDFSKQVPISSSVNPMYITEEQCRIWGVKWNVSEDNCDVKKDGKILKVDFSTAWREPNRWIETVFPRYEKLRFVLRYQHECSPQRKFIYYKNGERQDDDVILKDINFIRPLFKK